MQVGLLRRQAEAEDFLREYRTLLLVETVRYVVEEEDIEVILKAGEALLTER